MVVMVQVTCQALKAEKMQRNAEIWLRWDFVWACCVLARASPGSGARGPYGAVLAERTELVDFAYFLNHVNSPVISWVSLILKK